ncbi:MAG: argininosuccinate lyase [Desulfonauticus sp.]|nr:argininosuccinate lyase [Desulfonauticus sp.]
MTDKNNNSKKLWGGRFEKASLPLVEEYTQSVEFDKYLYKEDILGSIAHVKMLAKIGILSTEELEKLIEGLKKIESQIDRGTFEWKRSLEDVHMNIEQSLIDLIGEVGKKLHTGRSRNDQVALDVRLFVSHMVELWKKELLALIRTFVDVASRHKDFILPGFTHLQPAQPVSLAHHLLAYAWMFKRDVERLDDALTRVKVSPLGAAALAGSSYNLDPEFVASEVGFPKVFDNSMDAVSDRDFLLEILFCASVIQMHLSRFCEEIILWANPCFDFVTLPEEFATGSSIMPQKKNPDVAELMRGKTGRVYGNLMALLTVLKGLPLTYNRDLQEDKGLILDTHHTIFLSLVLAKGMLARLEFKRENMLLAVKKGFLNATELADYLVAKGIPFRDAHRLVGNLVRYAEKKNVGLEDLSLEEMREFCSKIYEDVFEVLDYEKAVERRQVYGGTGKNSVEKQIENLKQWLKETGGSV